MGIVLNEEPLATGVVSATWSPTASEVSGPDCTSIADTEAETCNGIGREISGASLWATTASSV